MVGALTAPTSMALPCRWRSRPQHHNRTLTDASLDHLVGESKQRVRNGNAERPGGVEVDDQFEFGWLHDRKVGWLLAFEDAAHIDAGLSIHIGNIRPIADQPADLCKI